MGTTRNTVVVDLGEQRHAVEDRVKSGSYASPDEVIQAAIRALEREEAATNEWLMQLAEESLSDPQPSIPVADVFDEIYAMHTQGKVGPTR